MTRSVRGVREIEPSWAKRLHGDKYAEKAPCEGHASCPLARIRSIPRGLRGGARLSR